MVAMLGIMPGITSHVSALEVAEDRTDWVIVGCSQRGGTGAGEDGVLALIKDGNANTFWHSNWESNHSIEKHFFVVDRGESLAATEMVAVGYTPRQLAGGGNGYVTECDIYVLDSIEGLTTTSANQSGNAVADADHASLTTFIADKTATAHGSFSYQAYGQDRSESTVRFETPIAGRYILFVATTTVGEASGNFANCAEFNAYVDVADPAGLFELALNADNIALAQKMALIKNVIDETEMPSTAVPEDISLENYEAKAAEVNTAIANYLNSFNGKRITIASTRRTNYPYLAAIPTGSNIKMNTQAAISPDAVWEIVMQTSGFKLYNRTTGKYIDNGGGIYFPKQNGEGLALAFGDGQNGLNVDHEAYMSNLTTWGSGDDGSRWNIAPAEYVFAAPETSTAEAPKYFRILNARWMYEKASPCYACLGENQDNSGINEIATRALASIPGIYWRIEAAGEDGAVKLVNLVGYSLTIGVSNGFAGMTSEGSVFYLHKQTAEQFAGIEECYAIASESTVGSANCLDATNYDPRGAKIAWNPTSDNAGHGNNGSLWYFIPATEGEIATATTTYINNVAARVSTPVEDESLSQLFGEEFVAQLYTDYPLPEHDLTTIAGVNTAKHYDMNPLCNAVVEKLAATVSGKAYMLRNCNTDYSNCYMTEGQWRPNDQSEYYTAVTPAADASNLATLWALDFVEGDTLKIRNVQSGLFVDIKEVNNQSQPMTEAGFEYVVNYNPEIPGFSFLAKDKDVINGIHQSDNEKLCRWYINNIRGSHWTMLALAKADAEIAATAENHTLSFPGLTLNTHESAADLVITIAKASEDEEPEIALASVDPNDEGTYTIAASDIVDGVATLSYIREGDYVINVPTGMFLANGIPTAAFTDKFSVDANGGVTGIDEIGADAFAGQTVIYDLQGRRLSTPVKGINIINGKKVLVK